MAKIIERKVRVSHTEANQTRRAKKYDRNRKRWANDSEYQARQVTRKERLLKITEPTPSASL